MDTGEKPALVKLTISALCKYHAAVFLDDQSLQLLYLEDNRLGELAQKGQKAIEQEKDKN